MMSKLIADMAHTYNRYLRHSPSHGEFLTPASFTAMIKTATVAVTVTATVSMDILYSRINVICIKAKYDCYQTNYVPVVLLLLCSGGCIATYRTLTINGRSLVPQFTLALHTMSNGSSGSSSSSDFSHS